MNSIVAEAVARKSVLQNEFTVVLVDRRDGVCRCGCSVHCFYCAPRAGNYLQMSAVKYGLAEQAAGKGGIFLSWRAKVDPAGTEALFILLELCRG